MMWFGGACLLGVAMVVVDEVRLRVKANRTLPLPKPGAVVKPRVFY